MSENRVDSFMSHDQTRGRNKRTRNTGADDDSDASSSRYKRTLTEEDKKSFVSYQEEMDERRDRYERIVKLSRDVIIEAKRIIFQLHRIVVIDTSKDKEKLLKEANERLDGVRNKLLQQMAKELYDVDQYYYIKAYDWAIEEYIEALAFHKFLVSGEVLLYSEVISVLQFVVKESEESKKLYIELPEISYLMGLFDVGGELMRLAISEVSSGNSDTAVSIVNYMRSLYECYEFLGNTIHTADWTKKSQVFRDCLMKVENALYRWKIRENDVLTGAANINGSMLT